MPQEKTKAPAKNDDPADRRTLVIISWRGVVPDKAEVKLKWPWAMKHRYVGDIDDGWE